MTGVLLINLGTPESLRTKNVRKYLRQFLSDPLVIDINPIARWFLVNFAIVPFRAPKSAVLYQKIWMPQGSPLLVHSRRLAQAVQTKLGDDYQVELAMRYGQPSIAEALKVFRRQRLKKIKVLPLYPQYALSSTQSSIDELNRLIKKSGDKFDLEILPPFYSHPGYLEAFAEKGRGIFNNFQADHTLFSFHGLPERHVQKTDSTRTHCLVQENCCDQIGEANKNCYRAQCFFTAKALADRLGIKKEDVTVCFQSRLGRTPWIKPYTDEVLPHLASRGKKSVAVFCPSFVADCLETLEEVALRNRDLFLSSGGKVLQLVPSLNNSPQWVETVSEMVRNVSLGKPSKIGSV